MSSYGYISKSFTLLLFGVMAYMHLCSVWCASGVFGRCNDSTPKTEQCHKSCCGIKEKGSSSDSSCQASHIAFFNSTGQFFIDFNKDVLKAYDSFQDVIVTGTIFNPAEDHLRLFAYTGFHPPPLNADIRTLIRSFQI